MDHGTVNLSMKLEDQGITGLGYVYYNRSEAELQDAAVTASEGVTGQGGTFLVTTGKHTGRSPKDKFVVKTPDVEDTIWWENNPPDGNGQVRRSVCRYADPYEGRHI
ncbi:MAG: phosphoenolpyruvate carboxykinase (ATP) [Yoonia sp.]|jgi:phosphoenolpyruvate carboxykinase (ATP)